MRGIFILALFFSPAAMAGYGGSLVETHIAVLSVVVLLLLIKDKVR